MKTARILPLLLSLSIGQALADTPINLTHDASPNARISISNVKGAVTVTAWDRNQVQVGGRLGDGAKPLAIEGSNSDMEIKVESQGKSGWFNWNNENSMGSTTLDVRVPKGASLDVDVVSAPLSIDGIDGGTIKANTVSGKARVNARSPDVDVESVSGSIELAGSAGKVSLQTVSGDILAPNVGNEAELQTVSGRIRVNGGPWRKLNLSTVSGDVQLSGGMAPNGVFDVDSMSGDVQVQVPSNLSATIHANTFSGDLRSDFGTVKKVEHGPGSELQATAGAGNAKMNIETFSGDLRIRHQD
ncbi:MAG TPA: DUF4097 family beta strand repeat-containing protein [Dyella sp.]|uniref:DUF4097 family beta strand repeat-containing protein n=1 Tax=Dyella sp. TaxID=1869338 RepID=UPI002D7A2C6D|nr:DUF4097 family beta strand repeat-containing protein [Dyella sp.]HET6554351.1 DUF4097 family beta strand repeat-containing protein [Dyella sp.]